MKKWKWDRGVDYVTLYRLISSNMTRAKKQKQKCYDSILLIQLRNGSRISEAVRAYIEYIKTRKTEIYIPISKKKTKEQRLMIIPSEAEICEELMLVDPVKLTNRLKQYSRSRYKINTHSLRYAFITYLLRQGISPTLIAKITGHSRLDYILTYTQVKAAEEILKNVE